MTVLEYLTNPYGKGSAFGNVSTQKQALDKQYFELQNKMIHKIFFYRNRAIYHVIVPSHGRNEKVTYDVILEIPFPEDTKSAISLENFEFQVFSNCPSFIFTYAHVFRTKGMLCNWLVDKYSMDVRRKLPLRTNQYQMIGFERSLYLAFKYLKEHGQLLASTVRNSPIKPHSYNEIAREVRTQEQILQSTKNKINVEPNKHLPPAKTTHGKGKTDSSAEHAIFQTPKTKITATTKKTKRGKTSNKI